MPQTAILRLIQGAARLGARAHDPVLPVPRHAAAGSGHQKHGFTVGAITNEAPADPSCWVLSYGKLAGLPARPTSLILHSWDDEGWRYVTKTYGTCRADRRRRVASRCWAGTAVDRRGRPPDRRRPSAAGDGVDRASKGSRDPEPHRRRVDGPAAGVQGADEPAVPAGARPAQSSCAPGPAPTPAGCPTPAACRPDDGEVDRAGQEAERAGPARPAAARLRPVHLPSSASKGRTCCWATAGAKAF